MEITIERRKTSFRLSGDLLDRMKKEAKKKNMSLNHWVETTLTDLVYREPNAETIAAIEEARAGKYAGTIDTSSLEAMIKSCEE